MLDKGQFERRGGNPDLYQAWLDDQAAQLQIQWEATIPDQYLIQKATEPPRAQLELPWGFLAAIAILILGILLSSFF
jgi:hypothetical protein